MDARGGRSPATASSSAIRRIRQNVAQSRDGRVTKQRCKPGGNRREGVEWRSDHAQIRECHGEVSRDDAFQIGAYVRAELGRAAWHVLHLMTLRYPDVSSPSGKPGNESLSQTPTDDDRQALKSYFHLFARLYPCGECAAEFQKLLKEYPPQVSERSQLCSSTDCFTDSFTRSNWPLA